MSVKDVSNVSEHIGTLSSEVIGLQIAENDSKEATEGVVEDNEKCAVCQDGEVYENNEILYCDKCNVAVHQLCYGVRAVPQGNWFCYPCAAKLDTATLPCELCAFKGGAYKQTDKPGKWAHPLCSAWIPELFDIAGREPPVISLATLDTKRFKLKCVLCHKKGACVQCCYGRCATAAHPWCVLTNPQGFTKRIVKDSDGDPVWEIFCKVHANSVKEPLKPRVGAKNKPIRHDEEPVEVVEHPSKLTMSSADHFDVLPSAHGAAGKGRASGPVRKRSLDREEDERKASSFPLLSLLEWPGISEGEGMDLDHYWHYISSHYPEDHTQEWLQFMTNQFLKPAGWDVSRDPAMHPYEDPVGVADEELEDQIDEILAGMGNERHRAATLDSNKRDLLLARVASVASALNHGTAHSEHEDNGTETVNGTSHPDGDEGKGKGMGLHTYALDASYYVRQDDEDTDAMDVSVDVDHQHVLTVLMDGQQRYRCDFAVQTNISDAGAVNLLTEPTDSEVYDAAAHLVPIDHAGHPSSDVKNALLRLTHITPVPSDQEVPLPNGRHIVAKDDDDMLSRLIVTDQRAYADVVTATNKKIEWLMRNVQFDKLSNHHFTLHRSDEAVTQVYLKQNTWRYVANGLVRGIKDQTPDFNKMEFEKLPASWALKVDGRDKKAPVAQDEEEEPHEDAICMCCFDGTSVEGNRIIYCDGCNITIHQICYGITEIPEGEYYCDRCKYVQSLDDRCDGNEDLSMKDVVKCVLCPVYHGGLKQTVCGRWVHLACAFWATDSIIKNLPEMTDIDIYNVPLQPTRNNRQSSASHRVVFSTISTACVYCKIAGGFVVKCDYFRAVEQSEDHQCNVVFHPLCAWFRGAFFRTTLTDSTYQAVNRDNTYPAGIDYCFFCLEHSSKHRAGSTGIDQQRSIRNKYCINIHDLDGVPGKNRRKRKKTVKKRAGDGKSTVHTVVKELGTDKYDHTTCAYCMMPMTTDIFNSGFDAQRLVLPPARDLEKDGPEPTHVPMDLAHDQEPAPVLQPIVQPLSSSDVTQIDSTVEGSSSSTVPPDGVTEATPPAAVHPVSYIQCAQCGICIHTTCAQEFFNLTRVPHLTPWTCYVCEKKLKHEEISCALCPRHGGMLHHTNTNQYMHVYCAKYLLPGVTISAIHGIDVKIIPKEYLNKNKCTACNRKTGICIPCNSLGCNNYYHPLCGKRNQVCIRNRNNFRELYCLQHIPEYVEYLSFASNTGYHDYVDLLEISKFTYTLERSRLIADQLLRREKYKKLLCKAETEIFQDKFNRLLDKAMHRKSSHAISENDFNEVFESESESEYYDSDDQDGDAADDGPASYLTFDQDPNHRNVTKIAIPQEDGEADLVVNSTWCNYKNQLKLPKTVTATLAGSSVSKYTVMKHINGKVFQKYLQQEITSTKESLRANTFIFESNKAEERFFSSLSALIGKQLTAEDEDFKTFLQSNHLYNATAFKPRGAVEEKRGKKVKKGYAVVEVESDGEPEAEAVIQPSGRRDSKPKRFEDDEPVVSSPRGRGKKEEPVQPATSHKKRARVSEAAPEPIEEVAAAPPTTKKAKVQSSAVTTPAPTGNDFDDIRTLIESTEYKSIFCSHFQRAKNFDITMDHLDSLLMGPTISSNPFDAHPLPSELCKLERILQDILFQIDNFTVQEEGAEAVPVPVPVEDAKKKKEVAASSESSRPTRQSAPFTTPAKAKSAPAKRQSPRSPDPSAVHISESLHSIPYDTIPYYDSYVRRVVTLDSMRASLQKHMYRSMDDFMTDLYTLLNNARMVTSVNSQTWRDTKLLAQLCEGWKTSVVADPCCALPRCQDKPLTFKPLSAASKGQPVLSCAHCDTQYQVDNWPSGFNPPGLNLVKYNTSAKTTETPKRATRNSVSTPIAKAGSDTWEWMCAECLYALGPTGALQGRAVQVWWHDDDLAYQGEITAYDESSQCPCVIYQDAEWEFVNLAVEPFVLVAEKV